LYGSPCATGYDLTDGFAFAYVWPNLRRYVGFLVSAETPLALAGLVVLAIPSRALWTTPSARRARPLFAGCAAIVWIVYLLYVPWDAWWYLRFFLPTWPLMAIGTASLVATLRGSPDRTVPGVDGVHPSSSLLWRRRASVAIVALLGALGFQWRETTADAVYQQANAVVPGTAGHGSLWTGMYVQLRADWIIAANLVGSVEAVHFQVGDSIRDAGGSNADYVGVELKYGW